MKDLKIAGIVTLYNPTDADIGNISTYIDDIDKLYIVDNTEGNSNEARIPNNNKIKYMFRNENIGVAAALNVGANLATQEGYEWLLTMDQDTTFKPGVIPKMKEIINSQDMSKIGIVTPWHKTKANIKKPNVKHDNPTDVMTSGNILNLEIFRKIGGFQEDFFIDGIDIEYCLKLHKNGYNILRINDLEIEHNLGDIFFRNIIIKKLLCTNHSYIRRYYIMRNNHYIYDMYKDYNYKFCKSIINQRSNILAVVLFEKDKYRKLRNYLRGYIDYKKGIKGKYRFKN